jgi:hypothetical protein
MKQLAPIALFCFKRLDTLERCVESLKNCPESILTELIIFSDEARNQDDREKVDENRAYLNTIEGFKSIRIIHRKENLGVDYNIINGIREMASEYEKFIVVEDDLVVSNQFIRFMNAGLSHFESFDKVLTITGFNFVKIPNSYKWDCFFAGITNPWGWATWSHKIKEVDWDLAQKENFLTNVKEQRAFNAWGSDRTRMLRRTLLGEIRAWDIRLDYFLFKNDFVTVYSCKNLVINNGFNNADATNTTGFNRYKVNLDISVQTDFLFPHLIEINSTIKRKIVSKNSIYNRIITTIFKKLNIKN